MLAHLIISSVSLACFRRSRIGVFVASASPAGFLVCHHSRNLSAIDPTHHKQQQTACNSRLLATADCLQRQTTCVVTHPVWLHSKPDRTSQPQPSIVTLKTPLGCGLPEPELEVFTEPGRAGIFGHGVLWPHLPSPRNLSGSNPQPHKQRQLWVGELTRSLGGPRSRSRPSSRRRPAHARPCHHKQSVRQEGVMSVGR